MSGVPTDLDTVCAGEHVLAADQRAPAHELHRAATERAHGRHPGLAASHARLPRHATPALYIAYVKEAAPRVGLP